MEEVETFLCSDGVDLRRDADGVAEKIMQSKDLMRVFSRRVGYATVTTELERGLHVCALIGSRDKDFRARFLEEVTVEQFVKLMNRERGNVAVQKKLMYFVNVLAVDDSIRENIVEGGAGEATVAVINAHLENDIVLERALMALSRLTIGKLALKLRLGKLSQQSPLECMPIKNCSHVRFRVCAYTASAFCFAQASDGFKPRPLLRPSLSSLSELT